MSEDYHRFYNDTVVRDGEPFNTEALTYLDGAFKGAVTSAMEACLDVRPDDPIRFLAEKLKAVHRSQPQQQQPSRAPVNGSRACSTQRPSAAVAEANDDDGEDADNDESRKASAATVADILSTEFALTYRGGVVCTVRSAAAHYQSSPSKSARSSQVLPGLPFHQLVAPTAYELETTLRNLEACAPVHPNATQTRTLVLVEPPPAPVELFFLQGIPYYSDLAHSLAQHQRRGNTSAPHPQPGQTYSQLAFGLLADSLAARVSTLQAVLDGCDAQDITTIDKRKPGGERVGVVLPAVQANYLHLFDAIDAGIELVMGGSPCTALTSMPTVLFVTYNTDADAAALTLARTLAAYLPHLEAQQRHGIAAMREASAATIKEFSYAFGLQYWDGVHERRENRDEARGIRRAGVRRVGRGNGSSNTASASVAAAAAAAAGGAVDSAVAVSPRSRGASPSKREARQDDPATEARRKKAAQDRELRRQHEDSAFLAVLHDLRSDAATAIQSQYRGWRARRGLADRPHPIPPKASATVPPDENHKTSAAASLFAAGLDGPKPADIPPLLWFALKELHRVHGEVFGYYTQSPIPEPRVVPLHRPSRRRLPPACDGDGASEADEWEREEVVLPPARLTQPAPHFNPLARLLDCHALAQCDRLHNATQVQRQCSGMSLLLRRSYDQIKSLVIDMAHIAYVELVHRRRLAGTGAYKAGFSAAGDVACFSAYVEKHLPMLLGAVTYPHALSRSVLGALASSPSPPMSPRDGQATALRTAAGIVDAAAINTEQLLVLADEAGSAARLGAHFTCVAPDVYLMPPFLAEEKWAREVGSLREHIAAQQHTASPTQPLSRPSTTPGFSLARTSPDIEPLSLRTSELNVDWWSLSPLPVSYVMGLPFTLVPRGNAQQVQRLPDAAQFVPSVVVRTLESTARPTVDITDGVDGEGGAGDSDAVLNYSARRDDRLTHFDQVVDGVMAKRLSARPAAPLSGSVSVSTQVLSPTHASRHTLADVTLDALFCSSLEKEEHRLRHLLIDQLVHAGCVTHYTAMPPNHGPRDSDDANDESLPLHWGFLALGMPVATPSRQAVAAVKLYKKLFEWVPSNNDGDRNGIDRVGSGRTGTSRGRDAAGGGGDYTAGASRENSITARSGRRRSLQRSTDMLNRLRDSVMSSQRLSFAASGNNSPLISTSISPTTTPRLDVPINATANRQSPRSPSNQSPTRAGALSTNNNNNNSNNGASRLGHNADGSGAATRSDGRRLRRRQEQAREEVKSPQAIAAFIAAQHARDGLDLQYHRAWFLPMPFKSLLPRLEVLVDATLVAIKAHTVLVLSADVLDAMQGLLVATVTLLSLAVTRVEAAKIGGAAVVTASGAATAAAAGAGASGGKSPAGPTARRSQLGLGSPVDVGNHDDVVDDHLQDDDEEPVTLDHPKLGFLRSFLTCLEEAVRRHGVHLEACVAEVQTVLSRLNLPLLKDIVDGIEAAEREPRVVECRQHVIRAVQATEHFCLCLLFATYLALPFASGALARDSTAPLPSFFACVASMPEVVSWLESIDPWRDAPHTSPDEAHLRYSNWLRRWDDDHYISYGAL